LRRLMSSTTRRIRVDEAWSATKGSWRRTTRFPLFFTNEWREERSELREKIRKSKAKKKVLRAASKRKEAKERLFLAKFMKLVSARNKAATERWMKKKWTWT